MTEPVDVRERMELCDLFLELGPDAPTLCEGGPQPILRRTSCCASTSTAVRTPRVPKKRPRECRAMVVRLRAGAPLIPWRLPRIRVLFNGIEYFIHHEDVRRANGLEPRPPMADLEALAWRTTSYSGPPSRTCDPSLRDRAGRSGRCPKSARSGDYGGAHRSGERADPLSRGQACDSTRGASAALPMPWPRSSAAKITL